MLSASHFSLFLIYSLIFVLEKFSISIVEPFFDKGFGLRSQPHACNWRKKNRFYWMLTLFRGIEKICQLDPFVMESILFTMNWKRYNLFTVISQYMYTYIHNWVKERIKTAIELTCSKLSKYQLYMYIYVYVRQAACSMCI